MMQSGYDCNSNDFENLIYPYVIQKLCGIKNKSVSIVDAGAGTGRILVSLQNAGFENLLAIDLDDTMRETFNKKNINLIVADFNQDTISREDESVDIVICKNVIEHVLDPSHMLKEFRRLLKKGGWLIIITDDYRKVYKTFYRDPTHLHPYDKEAINRLLRIFEFKVTFIKSFLPKYGAGRTKLYKLLPSLGFVGDFLIAGSIKI